MTAAPAPLAAWLYAISAVQLVIVAGLFPLSLSGPNSRRSYIQFIVWLVGIVMACILMGLSNILYAHAYP